MAEIYVRCPRCRNEQVITFAGAGCMLCIPYSDSESSWVPPTVAIEYSLVFDGEERSFREQKVLIDRINKNYHEQKEVHTND